MERVVDLSNMRRAYLRVVENKGAPGVDDVTVAELRDWLKVNWPSVKAALLEGRYVPQLVRAVDIAKPTGGVRTLGVPTVVDRLIQQALHQVLQPLFEPTFSDGSFGFRPGRNAHQAVCRAQAYIREGKRWVVDIDLENFFDRVNHDVLLARVARRVSDRRVLRGIRAYLKDVLRLRVNEQKSAVARPWERKFLGYTCTAHRESRLRIAPESVRRLKERVRELMRIGRGRSLPRTIESLNPLLRGWINYFQLTQSKGVLEELDKWLRRRLRCLLWRQWKTPRMRKLRALGLDAERAGRGAYNGRGPWWNAGASHLHQAVPTAYFTRLGLGSLLRAQQRLQSVG